MSRTQTQRPPHRGSRSRPPQRPGAASPAWAAWALRPTRGVAEGGQAGERRCGAGNARETPAGLAGASGRRADGGSSRARLAFKERGAPARRLASLSDLLGGGIGTGLGIGISLALGGLLPLELSRPLAAQSLGLGGSRPRAGLLGGVPSLPAAQSFAAAPSLAKAEGQAAAASLAAAKSLAAVASLAEAKSLAAASSFAGVQSRRAAQSLPAPQAVAAVPSVAIADGRLAGRLAASPNASPAPSQPPEPLANPGFSPTTSVRLNVNTALGGLGYGGSAVEEGANRALGLPLLNAVSFTHDTRLTLDTSFSGQDLFRVRLRAGNFGPSGFFSNPPTPLTRLDFAFEEPLCGGGAGLCGRDLVSVNRAYLELPLADGLRVSVGPRVMQVDLLPVWPSAYSASPILELFQRSGAAGAYSRRVGAGWGLAWQPRGRWRGLSLAYAGVAPQGGDGSPRQGGLFTGVGGPTNTLQLAYTRASWNLTATYTVSGQGALLRGTPLVSQLAAQSVEGTLQSWGLAGYWQPARGGWIPSISIGWGLDQFAFARLPVPGLRGATSSSWSVGLQWSDVFGAGNNVMLALGAPAQATALAGLEGPAPDDGALAVELAGQIRLSDGISLTPALFWLPRPRGALAGSTSVNEALRLAPGATQPSLSVWGAVLRTTLRF